MILAIESACYTSASIAVYGEGVADQRVLARPRDAAAQTLPAVFELCAAHGIDGRSLAAVAVDCGPGSFTGIRIGIATALGLRDGWGIATQAVSQFDLYFAHLTPADAALALLDARSRGQLYYAFRCATEEERRGVVAPGDLPALLEDLPADPVIIVGDTEVAPELLGGKEVVMRTVVDALALACEAERAMQRGVAREALEPVYLHTSLAR
jgi:tRNA threonylcarbamoyladenosine biosynthesis protein TsaB